MVSRDKKQRLTVVDLERAVMLTNAHGTEELARALAPFHKSPRLRDRQIHEIVTALEKREIGTQDERNTKVTVRAGQGSELTPAQWQKALEYIAPRLDTAAEKRTQIPEPVGESLRAQAIMEAWEELRPHELNAPEKLLGMKISNVCTLVDQDIIVTRSVEAQTRARIADWTWREMQDGVIERGRTQMRAARDHDDLPAQAWKMIAGDVLNGVALAQVVERTKTQKFAGKSLSESDASRIYHALDKVIEAPEREREKQLAIYAAATRIRFVASFEEIEQSRVKARTAMREHEQSERVRALAPDKSALEVESLSYRTFAHERDGYERVTLGQEVARLMRDNRAGFETALDRAESSGLVRDLIPAEKRAEVKREAINRGFWKLMPEEVRRLAQDERQLPENVERAAMQVSDRIGSAMLIERGLHSSQESEGKRDGERLLRESFREIDRAQATLTEAKVEAERETRRETFRSLRPALSESINEYLKGVLEMHGERAFERGKGLTHHTEATAQIIRDTFKEHNVMPEHVNFTEERIQSLARAIVEPLPQQLSYVREEVERHALGGGEHQAEKRDAHEAPLRGPTTMNRFSRGAKNCAASRPGAMSSSRTSPCKRSGARTLCRSAR